MRSDDLTEGRGTAETARGGASGGLNPALRPPASPGAASAASGARSGLPDRRQLLHLLDRAQRHVLTPGEAQLLRTGVGRLLDVAEAAARVEPAPRPVSRDELRSVLLAWAEDFAPDVAVRQVEWLVGRVAGLSPKPPSAAPVRVLTSKPHSSADDARAIAARFEPTRPVSPLQVSCPRCSAGPAERCRAVSGTVAPRFPHAARVRAAGGEQR